MGFPVILLVGARGGAAVVDVLLCEVVELYPFLHFFYFAGLGGALAAGAGAEVEFPIALSGGLFANIEHLAALARNNGQRR